MVSIKHSFQNITFTSINTKVLDSKYNPDKKNVVNLKDINLQLWNQK
jgi:hypothetical protein